MRINFVGSIVFPNPVVLVYNADAIFNKADYIAAGYKYFEAIAIGGGGGRGGNYFGKDFNDATHTLHGYGGMGGGGGFHRIRGVLSALPSSANVVVGGAGTDGTDLLTDALVEYDIPTTDGGDGGNSHFNNPACIASGGKGGKRIYSATLDVPPDCGGGDGGAGNSSASGGGGIGGVAGTTTTSEESPGVGTLVGKIGKGGGGGAGGVGISNLDAMRIEATLGEKGAYNPSDQSVFDVGGPIGLDGSMEIVPGWGGGARITPLNESNKPYGRSSMAGVVALRLTVN
jgi:hypothetical protein